MSEDLLGSGDRGSSLSFSWIEDIIFSRSTGVICFSLPRLQLSVESFRRNSGLENSSAEDVGSEDKMACSFESSDSILEEREGSDMSSVFDRLENFHCGHGINCGCCSGAQQNVSRFHNLQLRFSRRLPFSMTSEHFENTVRCKCQYVCHAKGAGESQKVLTRPHAKQILHIMRVDCMYFGEVDTEQCLLRPERHIAGVRSS